MIALTHPDVILSSLCHSDRPSIHPQALVEGARIGPGTRVWAFAHVAADAVVGADCNLCDHTFIEGGAVVGDRVTLKCGVYLWTGTVLEDDVFVGPNVSFTNDRYPRSRRRPPRYDGVVIRRGASVGAGAVLLPGIEIGAYAMIGAGAVVTGNVPAHALVYGNPTRQFGWVCFCGFRLPDADGPPTRFTCPECISKTNEPRG